ncbi:MAG: sugar phosphate isomerase/epimerase [Acidobacteria bacterium]|nr:sugar phosphate isomerase/epimerase [Acidobacteriota bacterium]
MLPRAAMLEVVRALGFRAVDVGLFERSDHYRTSELLADPRAAARTLREEFARAELEISDVFLQIGVEPHEHAVNDPDPSVRTGNRCVFERALEFTEALKVPHITGLPGVPQVRLGVEASFDLAVEETLWRCSRAAQSGIRYSVEPHVGSVCATPDDTKRFLESTAGLTLTLDYGHFIYAGFRNEDVHPLCRYASHVHVRGGTRGRLQAPVAESTIDFPGMIRGLSESGYESYLCLEYVWLDWQGCNTTDNVSETVLLRLALQQALQRYACR